MKPPYRVHLSRWTSERLGEQWSLVFEGMERVTRGTEAEARAMAAYYGWDVVEGESGEGKQG